MTYHNNNYTKDIDKQKNSYLKILDCEKHYNFYPYIFHQKYKTDSV